MWHRWGNDIALALISTSPVHAPGLTLQVSFIFRRVVLKEDFGLLRDEIALGGFSGRFDDVLHYVRIRPIRV